MKSPRTAKSQKARTSNKKSEKEPLAPKLVFELNGPCGKMFVQARTPDQARGVYLAVCKKLPRELASIEVIGQASQSAESYYVITAKRRGRIIATLRTA